MEWQHICKVVEKVFSLYKMSHFAPAFMMRLHSEHLVSIAMLQDMNQEMDSFTQARSSLLQVFGNKVTDASQRILKTFLNHISKDSSETALSAVPSLTPEKFAAWLLETLSPEELTDEF